MNRKEVDVIEKAIKLKFFAEFDNSVLGNDFLTLIGKNERCYKIFEEFYNKEHKYFSLDININNNLKTISSIGYFIRNFKAKIEKCDLWVQNEKFHTISRTPLYFRIFNLESLTMFVNNNLTNKDFRALLGSYSKIIKIDVRRHLSDDIDILAGLELEHMPNLPKLTFIGRNMNSLNFLKRVKPSVFDIVSEVFFYSDTLTKDRISKKRLCSSILRHNTKFLRKQYPKKIPRPSIIMNLKQIFKFLK